MRGPTLDQPDELRDSKLRINFAKKINVIWHDFQFNDLGLRICRDHVDDLFEPNCNGIVQYLATIFRTENDVILARAHDVSVRFILLLRGHVNSISRRAIYCEAGACLISQGESPGFTAPSLSQIRCGCSWVTAASMFLE